MEHWRLAIVDDEPWALLGMRDIIPWAEYGFSTVETFSNAEDCLEAALPFDAVITDIRLPGMDGLELAGRLLEEARTRAAVIVSAYRDFEYARKAISEGVLYYLLKPLDEEEVRRVAQKLNERLNRAEELASDEALPPKAEEWKYCYLSLEPIRLPDDDAYCQKGVGSSGNAVYTIRSAEPLPNDLLVSGMSRAWDNLDHRETMEREAEASKRYGFVFSANAMVGQIQANVAMDYAAKWKNAEIAKQFFVSEVYMSECFKRYTGTTLGRFIIDVRVCEAAIRLRRSAQSVSAIAEAVGYPDAGYFGRLFRKRMGKSPEQYRQEQKNEKT